MIWFLMSDSETQIGHTHIHIQTSCTTSGPKSVDLGKNKFINL